MKQILKIISILLLLNTIVLSDETGSASIFAFFNGVVLENNEVIIDGSYKQYTDDDGSVELILEVGKHQIEFFAKDENGANLGYVKKTIDVKDSRDTQVIISFDEEGSVPHVEIDTPIGVSDTKNKDTNYVGTLHGKVLTSDTKKAIINARVFVKGTSIDAKTDDKGNFSISIPAEKNVSISIVHSEYSAATIDNIFVKRDTTLKRKIELTPASMELEEFIVLAPKVKGSIASLMAEEKESQAITNIIGASEISKKGDSDAAGALKRVTGVTLIGSNVYVRGLGGRYSNVEMNSLPLPSPDPQRRTVPLDIFPSAVIGSMQVQKSATADIPASFGGGYVNIRTKDKSKENYLKISTEVKSNSSTGKEVDSYQGSDTDWRGQDDGYRAIPSAILNDSKIVVGERVPSFDSADNQDYTTAIVNRALSTTKEKLPYGGKISVEGAYNMELADKHEVSFFANYTYGQDHRSVDQKYYKYAYNQGTDSLYKTPEQYGDITATRNKYTNAGMFNASYSYANVFNIKYTKLYSQISEKVTKVADGIANSDDDWKIRYDLNWEERTLDTNQINGNVKYEIANYENNFLFGYELGNASLNQPNNYKYAYLRDIRFDGVVNGDPYLDRFSPNVFLNLTSDDEMSAYYLKNKTNVELFSKSDYIEIGTSSSSKTRESRYNKYQLNQSSSSGKLTDDIDTIYDDHIRDNFDDTFRLDISFQPAYWYDANVEENSYYMNVFFKPAKKLELLIGARRTDFQQTVFQYTNNNNVFSPIEKLPETLEFNDLLPSFALKYKFNSKNQINFSFSQTYVTPDLREFTSAEYFHPYEVATVKGNPNLKTTEITNYDLKYSHYFSDTENINFGLFYKNLDKPIEDVQLPSSSLPRYSYDNTDNAVLYGFEIDGRKSFSVIDSRLKNFYFSGNFSYTKSDVTLSEEQEALYTTNHRQLQGLSPIVINASLSYEKQGRNLALSYNKMGERLRKVGMIDVNDEYPDYYEVPPQIVDFVWIENFDSGISLKLKLKNLLDEETIWYQGSKDNITNSFKLGKQYSFSVSYKY
ncbi:MAG: TonB-dependent receptor [Sulfurimonas sp.]|jgi:TonB-dependent receptor|uniref:carboxypeptidase-like regulatory domain-containing protein n=1 Tax=Sulfurimonas sp. TaxID=2022749 RepID=UPI0039E3113F